MNERQQDGISKAEASAKLDRSGRNPFAKPVSQTGFHITGLANWFPQTGSLGAPARRETSLAGQVSAHMFPTQGDQWEDGSEKLTIGWVDTISYLIFSHVLAMSRDGHVI